MLALGEYNNWSADIKAINSVLDTYLGLFRDAGIHYSTSGCYSPSKPNFVWFSISVYKSSSVKYHKVEHCRRSTYCKKYFYSLWKCVLLLVLCTFCPVIQADPICDFISATNIHTITGHTQWSCTTAGVTSTVPCTGPWPGLTCSGSTVNSININNAGLKGKIQIMRSINM